MKIRFARIEDQKWEVVELNTPEDAFVPEGYPEIEAAESGLCVGDVLEMEVLFALGADSFRLPPLNESQRQRLAEVSRQVTEHRLAAIGAMAAAK